MKIEATTKRQVEKTLKENGFGQGTAKRIVSLIVPVLEGAGQKTGQGERNEDHRR